MKNNPFAHVQSNITDARLFGPRVVTVSVTGPRGGDLALFGLSPNEARDFARKLNKAAKEARAAQ